MPNFLTAILYGINVRLFFQTTKRKRNKTNEMAKKRRNRAELIRNIPIGEKMIFQIDKLKEVDSIQSTAYRITRLEPDLGKRFSIKPDYKNYTVTVTANPL